MAGRSAHADDLDALADLRQSTTTPILVSEYLTTRYEYKAVLEKNAADIIMIDPTWAGGITESKKIATMAETWKRPVAMHDCTAPLPSLPGCTWRSTPPTPSIRRRYSAYLRISYPQLVTRG